MKKLTFKYKRYLSRRSRREKGKTYRDRAFRKKRIGENTYLSNARYRLRNLKAAQKDPGSTYVVLQPKNDFAIMSSVINVIDFVHKLKSYAKPIYSAYNIKIDLNNVSNIDTGAICLLLSIVEELSFYKIRVEGTIPHDENCKKIFLESGFLKHISSISGGKYITSEPKNLILKRGRDRTKNQDVGETVKQAIKDLTGKSEHYPPIFSLVQEINGNSVEHAYDNKKEHWLFASRFKEDEDKVIFIFTDNGFGILKTLRRKLSQRFFDELGLATQADILEGAFTKKYSSRHAKQINRNKGLPLVRKIQLEGEVKNLMVITNGVFLYLDNYRKVKLNKSFSGTFYYWELDKSCLDRWKNKN
ncbi:MAG: hypothetical protein RJQ14_11870 [Marinoscillum sp.]